MNHHLQWQNADATYILFSIKALQKKEDTEYMDAQLTILNIRETTGKKRHCFDKVINKQEAEI